MGELGGPTNSGKHVPLPPIFFPRMPLPAVLPCMSHSAASLLVLPGHLPPMSLPSGIPTPVFYCPSPAVFVPPCPSPKAFYCPSPSIFFPPLPLPNNILLFLPGGIRLTPVPPQRYSTIPPQWCSLPSPSVFPSLIKCCRCLFYLQLSELSRLERRAPDETQKASTRADESQKASTCADESEKASTRADESQKASTRAGESERASTRSASDSGGGDWASGRKRRRVAEEEEEEVVVVIRMDRWRAVAFNLRV